MHPVTSRLPVFDVQLLEPEPTPEPTPEPEPVREHAFRPRWWVAAAVGVYLFQVATIIAWAVHQ